MAAFWRTFHQYGKISPGWWGRVVHAHLISLYLPSRTKLLCMLQLRGQIHSPYFISTPMYSVGKTTMPVKLRHPLVKIEKHRGKEASSPCLIYLSFSFCCFLLISCSGCLYRYIYVGLLSWGHFTEEIFSTIFPYKEGNLSYCWKYGFFHRIWRGSRLQQYW